HHLLRHLGRNREADADVASVRRQNLRVDPDQLAARVHQRPARVALVNGRIGLEEVLEAAAAHDIGRAALGANDAGRHRFADAERIPHGKANISDAHRVGIAELQHWHVAFVDFQNRQVARGIRANYSRRIRGVADEVYFDVLSAVDYVMVGKDVPISAHDYTRTQGALHFVILARPRRATAEELLEERVVEKREL